MNVIRLSEEAKLRMANVVHTRILLVSDVAGRFERISTLAKEKKADAVVHVGLLGLQNKYTVTALKDNVLEELIGKAASFFDEKRERLLKDLKKSRKDLSTFDFDGLTQINQYFSGAKSLDIPLYTCWDYADHPLVVDKINSGDYRFPFLNFINGQVLKGERADVRVFGLGGRLIMKKLFSVGRSTLDDEANAHGGDHSGSWITAAQILSLFDAANGQKSHREVRVMTSNSDWSDNGFVCCLAEALDIDALVIGSVNKSGIFTPSSQEWQRAKSKFITEFEVFWGGVDLKEESETMQSLGKRLAEWISKVKKDETRVPCMCVYVPKGGNVVMELENRNIRFVVETPHIKFHLRKLSERKVQATVKDSEDPQVKPHPIIKEPISRNMTKTPEVPNMKPHSNGHRTHDAFRKDNVQRVVKPPPKVQNFEKFPSKGNRLREIRPSVNRSHGYREKITQHSTYTDSQKRNGLTRDSLHSTGIDDWDKHKVNAIDEKCKDSVAEASLPKKKFGFFDSEPDFLSIGDWADEPWELDN